MTKVNDKVVKSSKDLKTGDNITIDFSDGNVEATVKQKGNNYGRKEKRRIKF